MDLRDQGGHTFILKIMKHLVVPFLTGCKIHYVQMIHRRSKKKTKSRHCEQNLFCMLAWQNWTARIMGHYIFDALKIYGVRSAS